MNKQESWQGYSAHITDDEARAAFVKKYGREPTTVKRTGGSVNVGPKTAEEVARE